MCTDIAMLLIVSQFAIDKAIEKSYIYIYSLQYFLNFHDLFVCVSCLLTDSLCSDAG